MIRQARRSDIQQCLEYARMFHAQSIWSDVEFCEQSTRQTMTGLIENEDGILYLTDSGFIGGVCAPLLFNKSVRIAYEMFWFAGKNGRELIQAFEDWAAEKAAFPLMVCLEDERVETVAKIYRRRGYTPSERYFVKRS